MTYKNIHNECVLLKNEEKKKILQSFFKTGTGQYGEGDIFWGITTPQSKKIAKAYINLDFNHIEKLLHSKIHEERIIGLHIMKLQYERAIRMGDELHQKKIYRLYYKLKKRVNNWDLVDSSAPYISGHYFFHYSRKDLEALSKSKSLWERRIAVVSMFYFIRQNELFFALEVISRHLNDSEDLMHKACGWMLREIGKRDVEMLITFLEEKTFEMSRTTLRYSIEKFDKPKRLYFLNKKAAL